jgi:hypothetical protein
MSWEYDEIVNLNSRFGSGAVINSGSLHYAIGAGKTTEDWLKQLAHLVRSLLVDYVFEDGNKRTAAVLVMMAAEERRAAYDPLAVGRLTTRIAQGKIKNISTIRRLIRDVLRG